MFVGDVYVNCAADPAFDKSDVCDCIVKHGGCLLDNFDLAAVRPNFIFVALVFMSHVHELIKLRNIYSSCIFTQDATIYVTDVCSLIM